MYPSQRTEELLTACLMQLGGHDMRFQPEVCLVITIRFTWLTITRHPPSHCQGYSRTVIVPVQQMSTIVQITWSMPKFSQQPAPKTSPSIPHVPSNSIGPRFSAAITTRLWFADGSELGGANTRSDGAFEDGVRFFVELNRLSMLSPLLSLVGRRAGASWRGKSEVLSDSVGLYGAYDGS